MELYACGFNIADHLGVNDVASQNQEPDCDSALHPHAASEGSGSGGAQTAQPNLIDIPDHFALDRVRSSNAPSQIRILFAGRANTLVQLNGEIHLWGLICYTNPSISPTSKHVVQDAFNIVQFPGVRSAFGTSDSVTGIIDEHGSVYLVVTSEDRAPVLEKQDVQTHVGAGIFQIAIAGNGTTAAVLANRRTIVQFKSVDNLISYLTTNTPSPSASHHLPDPYTTVSLIASASTFTILTSQGTIFTWSSTGLPYPVLGRPTHESSKIVTPLPIIDLEGLRVKKVACGSIGMLAGALADEELYIWGIPSFDHPPSKKRQIPDLPRRNEDVFVKLANILHSTATEDLGDAEDEEGIADFGVGYCHIVALTTRGRLFGVGGNRNGQLGLGGVNWINEWTEIWQPGSGKRIVGAECGGLCTFLLVEESEDGQKKGDLLPGWVILDKRTANGPAWVKSLLCDRPELDDIVDEHDDSDDDMIYD